MLSLLTIHERFISKKFLTRFHQSLQLGNVANHPDAFFGRLHGEVIRKTLSVDEMQNDSNNFLGKVWPERGIADVQVSLRKNRTHDRFVNFELKQKESKKRN